MMEADITIEPTDLTAVLDTNVLHDIFSCHDVFNMYEKVGEDETDGAYAVYRRDRVGGSLVLAMHLHNMGGKTFSLRGEPLRKLLENVDPNADDDFRTHYVKMFLGFVRPRLLGNWYPGMPSEEAVEPTGSKADAFLIDYAKQHGLPLITNEGFSPDGIRNEKMRKKAIAACVRVFTPREFYAGRVDEQSEIRTFLRRFDRRAPRYIAAYSRPVVARDSLGWMSGYYRHVLLGETAGRSTPVGVVVPP
jgi:hypothetical protein